VVWGLECGVEGLGFRSWVSCPNGPRRRASPVVHICVGSRVYSVGFNSCISYSHEAPGPCQRGAGPHTDVYAFVWGV